jgi:hypothetical protein
VLPDQIDILAITAHIARITVSGSPADTTFSDALRAPALRIWELDTSGDAPPTSVICSLLLSTGGISRPLTVSARSGHLISGSDG